MFGWFVGLTAINGKREMGLKRERVGRWVYIEAVPVGPRSIKGACMSVILWGN